jgi:hypothetical protein
MDRCASSRPQRLRARAALRNCPSMKYHRSERCPAFLHFRAFDRDCPAQFATGRNTEVSAWFGSVFSARARTSPARICSRRACDRNSRSDCPRSGDRHGHVPLTAPASGIELNCSNAASFAMPAGVRRDRPAVWGRLTIATNDPNSAGCKRYDGRTSDSGCARPSHRSRRGSSVG